MARTKKELAQAKAAWLKKYNQTELPDDWYRHSDEQWEKYFALKNDPNFVQSAEQIILDSPFNLYTPSARWSIASCTDNIQTTGIYGGTFFAKNIDAVAHYTKDGKILFERLFVTRGGGMPEDQCIKIAWAIKYCRDADKFMEQVFPFIKARTGASNQELL